MRNDINNDNILNLTYFNFCLVLSEEIADYFYSFFIKKIKLFSLSPKANGYIEKEVPYKKLEEDKIKFDSYIEDILEFDSAFETIIKILKEKETFTATRCNVIKYIKESPYYCLTIFKFAVKKFILIIYFYITINYNIYICSYNLVFDYTLFNKTFFPIINNTYIDNSFSNDNFIGKDSFTNYSYCPCKLSKCELIKIKYNKIMILRIIYFLFFDVPLICHGIFFLIIFKKIKIKKCYIFLYQFAEYIFLLYVFVINIMDNENGFYFEEDAPQKIFRVIKKNYNLLFILFDKMFNKFSFY